MATPTGLPSIASSPMNAPPLITVMIVDDHPLVRQGMSALINLEPDMSIVAEAEDGREVMELFRRSRPDVVLMDLRLRETSGVRVIEALRAEFPEARALVISSYDDEEIALDSLAVGAMGYLCKNVVEDQLIDAIREVHAGRHFLPWWVNGQPQAVCAGERTRS